MTEDYPKYEHKNCRVRCPPGIPFKPEIEKLCKDGWEIGYVSFDCGLDSDCLWVNVSLFRMLK